MRHSILVADDEQMNRQVILDMLKSSEENYAVLSATNGKMACEIALKTRPDIILMDWNMPEMTGIEAVKQLQKMEETRSIPVLMVTSITASEKLQEAFDAGAVDYVTKPIKRIELLARTSAALKTSLYQQKILRQKEEIEYKNQQISSSIEYAENIQKAILPKRSAIHNALNSSFVLFMPRDVVSGDFYWFYNHPDGKIYLAANDCTGHGVPGAFVSMIAHMLFNQVVIEQKITGTANILAALNKGMKAVFTKEDDRQYAQDGMDMTLCAFEQDLSAVEFSGAQNPVYLVRDNTVEVLETDRTPIGGRTPANYKFTSERIELKKGDALYLSSDGYIDQFGGPRGKKLKLSRFKELLLSIQGKDMKSQKEALQTTIKDWKGDLEQLDDILILGIKI